MAYTLPSYGPGVMRDEDSARIVPGAPGWSAYQAWIAAGNTPASPPPSPPSPRLVTYAKWLDLFTAQERQWAFASNDPLVNEMISRGAAAGMIDLLSPNVAAFLDLSISLGSPLTPQRKAQVIAGQAP